MFEAYDIHERAPTPDEYRAICEAVGWAAVINFEAAVQSLERSLFAVVVMQGDAVVGMGRIVGDGAIYFYIQDIAVMPTHQGRGVGQLVLQRLMAYLRDHAPDKAFVGLFATEGAVEFYRRYGFLIHSAMTGMFQVMLQGGDAPPE
jgi:ribosomal protein S18 acetylase RimI-like enzyme